MNESSCLRDGCGKPPRSKNWQLCDNHYRQQHATLKKHGNLAKFWMQFDNCTYREGCDNPVESKGLCNGHMKQDNEGAELTPMPIEREYDIGDGVTRRCYTCKSVKLLSEFNKNTKSRYGRSYQCRACNKVEKRAERINKYGITVERYDEMCRDQDYRCAICRNREPSGKRLAIDHDHECCPDSTSCGKCVRGLLCTACNVGLGYFKDDVNLLSYAAAYLETHKEARGDVC